MSSRGRSRSKGRKNQSNAKTIEEQQAEAEMAVLRDLMKSTSSMPPAAAARTPSRRRQKSKSLQNAQPQPSPVVAKQSESKDHKQKPKPKPSQAAARDRSRSKSRQSVGTGDAIGLRPTVEEKKQLKQELKNPEIARKRLPKDRARVIPYRASAYTKASNVALCAELRDIEKAKRIVLTKEEAAMFNLQCGAIDFRDAILSGSQMLWSTENRRDCVPDGASDMATTPKFPISPRPASDFAVVVDLWGGGFLMGIHAAAFGRARINNTAALYVTEGGDDEESGGMSLELLQQVCDAGTTHSKFDSIVMGAAPPKKLAKIKIADLKHQVADFEKKDSKTEYKEGGFFDALKKAKKSIKDVTFFTGLSTVNFGIDDTLLPHVCRVTGFMREGGLYLPTHKPTISNKIIWNRLIPREHAERIAAGRSFPTDAQIAMELKTLMEDQNSGWEQKVKDFTRSHLLNDLSDSFWMENVVDRPIFSTNIDNSPEAVYATEGKDLTAYKSFWAKMDRLSKVSTAPIFGDLRNFVVLLMPFESRRTSTTCVQMGHDELKAFSVSTKNSYTRQWHLFSIYRCCANNDNNSDNPVRMYENVCRTLMKLLMEYTKTMNQTDSRKLPGHNEVLFNKEDIKEYLSKFSFLNVGWFRQNWKPQTRKGSRSDAPPFSSVSPKDPNAQFGFYFQSMREYLRGELYERYSTPPDKVSKNDHPFASLIRLIHFDWTGAPRGSKYDAKIATLADAKRAAKRVDRSARSNESKQQKAPADAEIKSPHSARPNVPANAAATVASGTPASGQVNQEQKPPNRRARRAANAKKKAKDS